MTLINKSFSTTYPQEYWKNIGRHIHHNNLLAGTSKMKPFFLIVVVFCFLYYEELCHFQIIKIHFTTTKEKA